MKIDIFVLQATWDMISSKAEEATKFGDLLEIAKKQQRWMQRYREFADEFQSLWILELLGLLELASKFTVADMRRAAYRAQHVVRRTVKRSLRNVPVIEATPDRSQQIECRFTELTRQLRNEVIGRLKDDELKLLDELLATDGATPPGCCKEEHRSKLRKLRKKIEPAIKTILGGNSTFVATKPSSKDTATG